jgi:hypothetical protein
MPSGARTPPDERHAAQRQSPYRNALLGIRNVLNIRAKKPLFTSWAADPERKHPIIACELPVRNIRWANGYPDSGT